MNLKPLFIALITLLFCSSMAFAQSESKPEKELSYGSSTELDTTQLTQRVDDLTDAVGQLAENDKAIESRLSVLESKPATLQGSFGSVVSSGGSSGTLSTQMPMVSSVRSFGAPGASSWGSSNGSVSSPNVSNRFVSAPMVTYQAQPQIVAAPVVTQVAAAPQAIERRQIVRVPVTRVVTQNVSYEQAPSCPGGNCSLSRGPLGFRRRSR